MKTISPTAAELLAELHANGIDVKRDGDDVRIRPHAAMTPDLLARLRTDKAELLRFLDTDAAIVELRESVHRLHHDAAWRSAWERRFTTGRYADFASLQRVVSIVIDQAEQHHRRRDWTEFVSTCNYLHRLVWGELWDEAEQTGAALRGDLTAWLIVE